MGFTMRIFRLLRVPEKNVVQEAMMVRTRVETCPHLWNFRKHHKVELELEQKTLHLGLRMSYGI